MRQVRRDVMTGDRVLSAGELEGPVAPVTAAPGAVGRAAAGPLSAAPGAGAACPTRHVVRVGHVRSTPAAGPDDRARRGPPGFPPVTRSEARMSLTARRAAAAVAAPDPATIARGDVG
ncbi:hypothetical protein GCM10009827_063010 [Dactylosporangium maewongense]|uniref:Uncharacterized protein n=1 Tax=Dactylosporangium maewongense TaxID=634393 RepID=A0ABN2BA36_9ACTN